MLAGEGRRIPSASAGRPRPLVERHTKLRQRMFRTLLLLVGIFDLRRLGWVGSPTCLRFSFIGRIGVHSRSDRKMTSWNLMLFVVVAYPIGFSSIAGVVKRCLFLVVEPCCVGGADVFPRPNQGRGDLLGRYRQRAHSPDLSRHRQVGRRRSIRVIATASLLRPERSSCRSAASSWDRFADGGWT